MTGSVPDKMKYENIMFSLEINWVILVEAQGICCTGSCSRLAVKGHITFKTTTI